MLYYFVILMTRAVPCVSMFQGAVEKCSYADGKAALLYCVARCVDLAPVELTLPRPCNYDIQAYNNLTLNVTKVAKQTASPTSSTLVPSSTAMSPTLQSHISTYENDSSTSSVISTEQLTESGQPTSLVTFIEPSVSFVISTEQFPSSTILFTEESIPSTKTFITLIEQGSDTTQLTSETIFKQPETSSVVTGLSSEQPTPDEQPTNKTEQSTVVLGSQPEEVQPEQTSAPAEQTSEQSSSLKEQQFASVDQTTVQYVQTEEKIDTVLFALLQQAETSSEQPTINQQLVEQSTQQIPISQELAEQSTSSTEQPTNTQQTYGEQMNTQPIKANKLALVKPLLTNTGDPCHLNLSCAANKDFFKNGRLDATMIPGQLVPFCGKLYFVGTNKTSADEACALCCALGMEMLTLDSVEELFCVSRFIRNNLNKMTTPSMIFWSSARRDASNNLFRWCSHTNANVNKDIWVLVPVKLPCVKVVLATELIADSGARPALCQEQHNVLCQAEDPSSPTSPAPTTEDPDCKRPLCPSLLCNSSTSVQENKISVSNFLDLGPGCGSLTAKRYFLSNFKVTHAGGFFACCKIQMSVVAPVNETEAACLRGLLSKALKSNSHFAWTAGTSQGCRSKWRFCTTDVILNPRDLMWASTQPDNRHDHERCLGIGKQIVINGIMDFDCDSLFPVVCEKPY